MGLDTYASNSPHAVELTAEQAEAFEKASTRLCGGILSGGGASFRGKVYHSLILTVTGESLYQAWIPPETVQRMSRALTACDPREAIEASDGQVTSVQEVLALQRFFEVCADHGLGLHGWW